MGVSADSRIVLFALYRERAPSLPKDAQGGRYTLSGEDLFKRTALQPAQINDAVEFLAAKELVQRLPARPPSPFDFGGVDLTAMGRLHAEQYGAGEAVYPEGRARLVLDAIYRIYLTQDGFRWSVAPQTDALRELGLTEDECLNALERLAKSKLVARQAMPKPAFTFTLEGVQAATKSDVLERELPLPEGIGRARGPAPRTEASGAGDSLPKDNAGPKQTAKRSTRIVKDLADVGLTKQQHFVLDLIAEYAVTHPSDDAPFEHVRLKTPKSMCDDPHVPVLGLEQLHLVESVGGVDGTLPLTASGLLLSDRCDEATDFAEGLLTYLQKRIENEGVGFVEFTWTDLRTAGVAVRDDQFGLALLVVELLRLRGDSSSSSKTPPASATWSTPKDKAAVRDLNGIDELYRRATVQRPRPSVGVALTDKPTNSTADKPAMEPEESGPKPAPVFTPTELPLKSDPALSPPAATTAPAVAPNTDINDIGGTSRQPRDWRKLTTAVAVLIAIAGAVWYLNRPMPAAPVPSPGPVLVRDPCVDLDRRIEELSTDKRAQARKLSAMLGDAGLQVDGTDAVEETVRTTYAALGERTEACRLLHASMQCADKRSPSGPLALKLADAVIPICGGGTVTPPLPSHSSPSLAGSVSPTPPKSSNRTHMFVCHYFVHTAVSNVPGTVPLVSLTREAAQKECSQHCEINNGAWERCRLDE